MKKKKSKLKILLIPTIPILLILIFILSNPYFMSNKMLKSYLLMHTPKGSSMEDVIKVIESKKKWELVHVSENFGYGIDKWGTPREGDDVMIGVKRIRANTYTYRIIFEETVVVFWGFDEEGKLIDLDLRRDADSL